MTPIPVVWLSLHENIDARGPWDTRILEALFDGSLWPHDLEFTHCEGISTYPTIHYKGFEWMKHERVIVVLPARHHCSPEDIRDINDTLSAFRSVLLILCGDEEGKFPWKDIKHPNIRFWVQMPDPAHYADMVDFGFFFGNGWGAATPELIAVAAQPKDTMWSFAGQATNSRRLQAANGLRRAQARIPGRLTLTNGFAQGKPAEEYAAELARTWVAPCPSGPESPDTFRVYEALEAGAIPIVDSETPYGPSAYWRHAPLPLIDNWEGVGGLIRELLARRHWWSAMCSSWWQEQKSAMVDRLENDLMELGFDLPEPRSDYPASMVQVLITTSPSPKNPSLDDIQQAVASVEEWLGGVDILIACDGVRPEQQHLAAAYEEYLYLLTRWANNKLNVLPLISTEWRHQAGLARWAMRLINKPTVLFMEHDAPLVTDEFIDWNRIVDVVANGHVDVMRFHHESMILRDHNHLMIDHHTRDLLGVPVRRTRQWSQRPHLANTAYYRRILAQHFTGASRTMIEDKMHSVAQSEPGHRLAIYHPEYNGNIKRSYHLDGRGDEPKFEMRF